MPKIIDADVVLPIAVAMKQSDWDENDVTSLRHILHRTHYKIKELLVQYDESINLSVDGEVCTGIIYGYNQYPQNWFSIFEDSNYMEVSVGENIYGGFLQRMNSSYCIGNGALHNPDYFENNGLDWCIYCDSIGFDYLHFMLPVSEAGNRDITLSLSNMYVKKLDEIYLPDSIARKADITGEAVMVSERDDIITIKTKMILDHGVPSAGGEDVTLSKVAKTGDYDDLTNKLNWETF